MLKMFFWITSYTFVLALSQVMLKLGLIRVGAISARHFHEVPPLLFKLAAEPLVIGGTLLMASSYFLWLMILSWFKLSFAFPLTAIGFIFVALLSYFMLDEKLYLHNYAGIVLIAAGIFLLLFKQG